MQSASNNDFCETVIDFQNFGTLFEKSTGIYSVDNKLLRHVLADELISLFNSQFDFEFVESAVPDRFAEFATRVEEETGCTITKKKSLLVGSYEANLQEWAKSLKRDTRFQFVLALWYGLHCLGLARYAKAIDLAVLGKPLKDAVKEASTFEEMAAFVEKNAPKAQNQKDKPQE